MNNHLLFSRTIIVLLSALSFGLNTNLSSSNTNLENTNTTTTKVTAEMTATHLDNPGATDKRAIMTKKIKEMNERYHRYRAKSSEIYKEKGWNSQEMADNDVKIKADDKTNCMEARSLFYDYGLPTISKVGEELAHQFWLIVVQCNEDEAFQQSVLRQMYDAMGEGDYSTKDYAYLTDRVRVNRGKEQIYGTQVKYNEQKKTYEPYDLKDVNSVDQRRLMMGLEPMKKYINKMNLKYEASPKRNSAPKRLNRKV